MKVRRNFLTLPAKEQQQYIDAVKLLKKSSGNIYDSYVKIHQEAFVAQGNSTTSAAHGGPAFLPWHRAYLLTFEIELRKVLGDPQYSLPYWAWIDDSIDPKGSKIWDDNLMGGGGFPVTSGPFTKAKNWQPYSTTDPLSRSLGGLYVGQRPIKRGHDWGWLSTTGPYGTLPTSPEPQSDDSYAEPALSRQARAIGSGGVRFPTLDDFYAAIKQPNYDSAPWTAQSTSGFRNYLEGWNSKTQPMLHNAIHAWIYGQMNTGGSPDDPIFFLHHCYIDYLWAWWSFFWLPFNKYMPENGAPLGHNLHDKMQAGDTKTKTGIITAVDGTPADFLDHRKLGYVYDLELNKVQNIPIIAKKVAMRVKSSPPQAMLRADPEFSPPRVGNWYNTPQTWNQVFYINNPSTVNLTNTVQIYQITFDGEKDIYTFMTYDNHNNVTMVPGTLDTPDHTWFMEAHPRGDGFFLYTDSMRTHVMYQTTTAYMEVAPSGSVSLEVTLLEYVPPTH